MDETAVQKHLRHMGFQQAAGSVYERKLALARTERWLGHEVLAATPEVLMEWRASIDHLAPATIATYVAHLRDYWTWAIIEGYAETNPALRIPMPPVPRRLPRPIADDDLMRAVIAAPHPIRLMIILAAWCGLRCKEIALLQRHNVLDRLPKPSILIAAGTTKGWRERMVPMPSFVVGEMYDYGLPTRGWLFLNDAGKPLRPATVSKRINTFLHELGILDTAHSGRHWYGTKLYQVTKDLRLVQEMLGHHSSTTAEGYTAYDLVGAHDAVELLPVPHALAA